MNDSFKIVIVILVSTMIMKILMNTIDFVGLDFVGFFESLWQRMKKNGY
ncbi:hypothetical protein REC12_17640 [Desulfosporosinus sp. PR]|nr:hypothetical protein [Desulfosporosinus sp. PR]MDQ7095416.1 hypothetical protein [Desulfosporosinus sp. PR]